MQFTTKKISTLPIKKRLLYLFFCSYVTINLSAVPPATDRQDSLEIRNTNVFEIKPTNMKKYIVYDDKAKEYVIYDKVGNFDLTYPKSISKKDYLKYDLDKSTRDYWRVRAKGYDIGDGRGTLLNKVLDQYNLNIKSEVLNNFVGIGDINIKPAGAAEITFGVKTSKIENPQLQERLRKNTVLDFKQKLNVSVNGSIGNKMNVGIGYDTEAAFEWENKIKIGYEGSKDEIIQKIEIGDISMPLSGTLIKGVNSLKGVRADLRFGNLYVSGLVSQQKSEVKTIKVEGGAQVENFEIPISDYDANRHFFLSNYFEQTYNDALERLPIVNSVINITKIEVWITNRTGVIQNANNIIGFSDLGEGQGAIYNTQFVNSTNGLYPDNNLNNLYQKMTEDYNVRNFNNITSLLASLSSSHNFVNGIDYEKIEMARKLTTSEYSLNNRLGYISLNRALNYDEILAVAYQYNIGGKIYQVGELSTDGISSPNTLILKLLKSTNLEPSHPTWNLMMKNIYAVGAYQVKQENFILNILYRNDQTGTSTNFIPEGDNKNEIILKMMNLDNINSQGDPSPDGVFDFITDVTINPLNGRVIFPTTQPFGKELRDKITGGNNANSTLNKLADKYVYEELYTETKIKAIEYAQKDKFLLKGTYETSSGSNIPLNAINIPKGSVVVTAGGAQLVEGKDYVVDYNLGRVRILNESIINSGVPINVKLESNTLFSSQLKTLMGFDVTYKFNKDFNLGATLLYLNEKSITEKVAIDQSPSSNTIWGLNTKYKTESMLLSRFINYLPYVNIESPAALSFEGEFAQLITGIPKSIGENGTVYIDDFENAKTGIGLKAATSWALSSTPQDIENADFIDSLTTGFRRAKLSWYSIDPLFSNKKEAPDNIRNDPDELSSHFVREINEQEVFPFKQTPSGISSRVNTFGLSFYPEERGPYNYETTNINTDGTFINPSQNWGGVMKNLEINNFESSNIEYIEFWLMDPFVEDENNTHTGGDLYINLGEISEDILKDGRKSYENGISNNPDLIDFTSWGKVPAAQSIINAFDNNQDIKNLQDVGLDGLNDEGERLFFNDYLNQLKQTVNADVYKVIEADPSQDNFHYFKGDDYDNLELGVLDRYKHYNGMERNSTSITISSTQIPDKEDLNRDNTLSEKDNYYQYKVSLRKEDLEIGNNFVVDSITSTVELARGEDGSVTWYQFRIPIDQYEKKIGDIKDFRSIRFFRLFLKGFSEEIHLRFVTLDLLRSSWRKYQNNLLEASEQITNPATPNSSLTNFEISAVNIEENSNRSPVKYVLPPGLERSLDPVDPQNREINEQSLSLKVTDLADADIRAVYKNLNMDIRNYKQLKMDIHAEAVEGYLLEDGEVSAIIRLGTDFTHNYYEYEIPLKVTPANSYTNSDEDRKLIWPRENKLEMDMDIFYKTKLQRNNAMQQPNSTLRYTSIYEATDGENSVKVVGNPNLGDVRVIMLGIKNRTKNKVENDLGENKSVEVWMNELRITDFDNEGGWATRGNMTANFGDFGNATLSGYYSTPGFGELEASVNERSRETMGEYNFSTNIQLGKLLPPKLKLMIPMYFNTSEKRIDYQYSLLTPDVPLALAVENAITQGQKDSIKMLSQDYTNRKSISFSNIRVENTADKPKFHNISNFSTSFSYSKNYRRNIVWESKQEKVYKGSFDYNFNNNPKNYTPFSQSKLAEKPYLKLIKDFNFYLFPSQLSVRTDIIRNYNEQKYRNIDNPELTVLPIVTKDFLWNRHYNLNYKFTRSLTFDYSASNYGRIDEPEGVVTKDNRDEYEIWKDSVTTNINNLGRTTDFDQMFNLSYKVPIHKIPFLSWVSLNSKYSATYKWTAAPLLEDVELGNTISNSGTLQFNGQLNFTKLYNQSEYLKKVEKRLFKKKRGKRTKTRKYTLTELSLKKEEIKSIYHKLGTENITVKAIDLEQRKQIKGTTAITNKNRLTFTPHSDANNVTIYITGKIEEKNYNNAWAYLANTVTGLKNISFSYKKGAGSLLPGYLPETQYAGMKQFNGNVAPGPSFILGIQDPNFAREASRNNWLTNDSLQISPYIMNTNEDFSARASFVFLKDLKLNFTVNRTYSENIEETYFGGHSDPKNRIKTGNFTMSFIGLKGFSKMNRSNTDYTTKSFEKFIENRKIISKRLAERQKSRNPNYSMAVDEQGFYEGYGPISQEVLTSSFLSSYGSSKPNKVWIDEIPSYWKMLPNWSVTFSGLRKINLLKKITKSINITHSYKANYTISSFSTNFNYSETDNGFNATENFYSKYDFSGISIVEQFSPLFGINITLTNGITSNFQIKKSKNANISFASSQISEIESNEFIFGIGYKIKKFNLILENTGGKQSEISNDLNLRFDLSFKNNRSLIRRISEDLSELSAGQKVVSLRTYADYVINRSLTMRLFYDRTVNQPFVSSSFPTINSSVGITARFVLIN